LAQALVFIRSTFLVFKEFYIQRGQLLIERPLKLNPIYSTASAYKILAKKYSSLQMLTFPRPWDQLTLFSNRYRLILRNNHWSNPLPQAEIMNNAESETWGSHVTGNVEFWSITLWRSVILFVVTNISEERIISIFRIELQGYTVSQSIISPLNTLNNSCLLVVQVSKESVCFFFLIFGCIIITPDKRINVGLTCFGCLRRRLASCYEGSSFWTPHPTARHIKTESVILLGSKNVPFYRKWIAIREIKFSTLCQRWLTFSGKNNFITRVAFCHKQQNYYRACTISYLLMRYGIPSTSLLADPITFSRLLVL
jgi:hypothetical protein